MKWKAIILTALIFFGVGFVVGRHPTFASVQNFIIAGVSLGLVVNVVGLLAEWFKERKEERVKKHEKLEEYVHKHNQKLVDTVIKPWYKGEFVSAENEPFSIEHLQTGYADVWELKQEYNILKNHLSDEETIIKEYIKSKLEEGVPPNLEQDISIVNPSVLVGRFALDNVENFIYETAREVSKKQGIPVNYKLHLQNMRRDDIEVLIDDKDKDLLEKMESFWILVETIIKDRILYEKFETSNKTRKLSYKRLDEFYQELKTIEHDFIERHVELNGTCKTCKEWHDELKSNK